MENYFAHLLRPRHLLQRWIRILFENDWPNHTPYDELAAAYYRIGATEAGEAIRSAVVAMEIADPENKIDERRAYIEQNAIDEFGAIAGWNEDALIDDEAAMASLAAWVRGQKRTELRRNRVRMLVSVNSPDTITSTRKVIAYSNVLLRPSGVRLLDRPSSNQTSSISNCHRVERKAASQRQCPHWEWSNSWKRLAPGDVYVHTWMGSLRRREDCLYESLGLSRKWRSVVRLQLIRN